MKKIQNIFNKLINESLSERAEELTQKIKEKVETNEDLGVDELNFDDEYEVDELMTLYKNYDKKIGQMNDTNMVKMICHYYSPQVEVIDNKYVTNIKCNLWSKHDDIKSFLNDYKFNIINICFQCNFQTCHSCKKRLREICNKCCCCKY